MAPATRPPKGGFFVSGGKMDLFVYSDESGVFDREHNEIFVFGGLIFLGKEEKDKYSRRYIAAEETMRKCRHFAEEELKASRISNKEKGKLYRAMNGAIRFGVIVDQKRVMPRIFISKKDKQRYLDYAYKIGLKRALEKLINDGKITKTNIDNVHIYNDEHTTATNGRYELKEAIENELKNGTYNIKYDKFFPPTFENLNGIDLHFCDSKRTTLVRAADIVANRIYYMALNRNVEKLENIYLTTLP